MSNDAEAYRHAMAEYEAGIAEEQSKYKMAKLAGDVAGMAHAGQAIAAYRTQADQFHREAVSYAQSMQQAQAAGAEHGLSPDQKDIALNSFGPIRDRNGRWVDMTDDQKMELYNKNRQKLARMRADGSYHFTTEQTG